MRSPYRNLGGWLFKYRSFLPVPLLFLVVILFRPADLGNAGNPWLIAAGLFLVACGETVRILVVGFSAAGTSGREDYFRADSINTTGVYSLVRNPLYIGNILIYNGLIMLIFRWPAFLLVNLYFFWQYHLIIGGEEEYLENKYRERYRDYRCRVNRILPSFRGYRKNRYPFNPRKVVFKEIDSVFNFTVCFTGLLIYRQLTLHGRVLDPLPFVLAGTLALTGYLILKSIKRSQRKSGS